MRNVDLSITFVYVIDESLGMSKGKIAAQVSHVAMELADEYKVLGRAIVLKADHNTFMRIFNDLEHALFEKAHFVLDVGLTEVAPNTMTCIGFKQTGYSRSLTKNLKLV